MAAPPHGDPQRADRRARLRAQRPAREAAARRRAAALPGRPPLPRCRRLSGPGAPVLAATSRVRSPLDRARSLDPGRRGPHGRPARAAAAPLGPRAKLGDDDGAPANLEVVFTVLLAGIVFKEHLGARI